MFDHLQDDHGRKLREDKNKPEKKTCVLSACHNLFTVDELFPGLHKDLRTIPRVHVKKQKKTWVAYLAKYIKLCFKGFLRLQLEGA